MAQIQNDEQENPMVFSRRLKDFSVYYLLAGVGVILFVFLTMLEWMVPRLLL